MSMTNYEKMRRSLTKKAVVAAAPSVGIEVVDPFSQGGLALVGKKGDRLVIWLESDGQWHDLEASGF